MKKLSLLLTLLLMTTLGASAYTSNLYIWGERNNWTSSNSDYTLSSISDGVYEGTFTFGPGQFKFGETLNSWNVSYGGAGTISQLDHEYSGLTSNNGSNMTFSLPEAEYKFHVDLTTGKLIVSAVGEVSYPAHLYIWGAINGQGWNNNDATYTLDPVSGEDGVYEGTFDITSAGQFKFGVELGSWTLTYGAGSYDGEVLVSALDTEYGISSSGSNIGFSLPNGEYTFHVDLVNGTVKVTSEQEPVDETPDAMYLIGTLNNWDNGNALAMTKSGDVFSYSGEFANSGDGYSWFSFTSVQSGQSDWSDTNANRWGPATNGTEAIVGVNNVDGRGDLSFKIEPGTYTLAFDYQAKTLTITGTVTPVEEKTFIKGTFNSWATVEMTKGNDGKYTFTSAMEAGVEFGFEDENGGWIGADGSGMFEVTREQVVNGTELSVLSGAGVNFTIPVAGTWTLTLDRETMKLVISGEWPEPVVETNYFLAYGPKLNDGEEGDAWTMVELVENNGIYSVAQNTAVYYNDTPRSFMFKIVKQTTGNEAVWYGSNTELSSEVLSLQLSDSGADIEIPAFTRGDWTFSFNPETEYLMLAGTWTNPVTYAYLYGIGGDWSTPVELTLSDGVYQKAVTITDVDGQGYGYVKVQVMTDYVDNQYYQFLGPESEGDFLITAATANTDIPLPYSSSDMGDVEAFQVPAGDYTISVDVYNSTVRFAGNVIDKQTLSDVLDGANDGDEVALSESLKVLYVDEQGTAFATNGNGQWIALAGGDFVKDNAYKNIQGILGSKATEPTITVSASALDEAAQIETEIPVIDLTADEDFEVFAAEVATFKGYYSAGTGCLSQWKNSKGNSLKLEGADIEDGKFMAVTVALKKNAAAGAPRRAPGDSENKLEGFTGSVLESESLEPTAVDTVNAGQPVVSVRYYNVAGAQSSKPFSGMNIVVTKFADGTVKTAKVVK